MRTESEGETKPNGDPEALDELVEKACGDFDEELLLTELVETVAAVCSPAHVGVWTFDDETDGLTPFEHLSAAYFDDTDALLTAAEEVAWEAYSEGSTQGSFHEGSLHDGFPDSVGSCLSLSLGKHGVLLSFFASEDELTETDRSMVCSAASIVRFSLEAAENEDEAVNLKREVEKYRRRTGNLEEIIETIRGTSQELLSATTRTEIEQAACRRLVASPFVEFAWMGKYVESGEEMVPEYSTDEEYFGRLDENGGTKMAKEFARSREPSLVSDLRGDPPLEPWREQALRYGFRSVMRVPILHKSSMYGVLTAYSNEVVEEDDHLWSAVKDIGNIVGHAINTYETKTALVSDRVTEIRFRVADPAFPAVRFASAVDGTVTFESATARADGPHRVYVSVKCDGEDSEEWRAVIEGVAETTPLIHSYKHITTRDDAEVYSVVGDISFFHQVLDRSGTLMEMTATGDKAEILVELPRYASVKSFVSMVEGEYDDVQVLSTRTKEKEFRTESGFKGELKEELTERQLETLQTAYYSGYFDSPRESTGQDLAEQLDVTQPTVTENIKAGQSKLLSLLFDE